MWKIEKNKYQTGDKENEDNLVSYALFIFLISR
jgi:hypothetical protein